MRTATGFHSTSGERCKTVRPFMEDKRAPLASPEPPQHFPSDTVVVVLGVMYPTVFPWHVEAGAHPEQVPLPPGLDSGRQSADVVFYDPLSSSRAGDEVHQAPKYPRNSKGDG